MFLARGRLVGLVVKASTSIAADLGSIHAFAPWIFSQIVSYQWLKNWYSSTYPARHQAL